VRRDGWQLPQAANNAPFTCWLKSSPLMVLAAEVYFN
jgi:hypothetical protein